LFAPLLASLLGFYKQKSISLASMIAIIIETNARRVGRQSSPILCRFHIPDGQFTKRKPLKGWHAIEPIYAESHHHDQNRQRPKE
jgi:hypothetical protein